MESPQGTEQQKNEDKELSLKPPKLDMKSYCKNLFSTAKPKRAIHRFEVYLEKETYIVEFDTNEKMKLAIGELKLLIESCEKDNKKKNRLTE
jgi:hypothetical protein